jgi:hypothetical protein
MKRFRQLGAPSTFVMRLMLKPPGEAIHASHCLVLLKDGTDYVGSYIVESRPLEITLATIEFDYPETWAIPSRAKRVGRQTMSF